MPERPVWKSHFRVPAPSASGAGQLPLQCWLGTLQHSNPPKPALNSSMRAFWVEMPLQTRAARLVLARYLARRRRSARAERYRGPVSEPREPVVVVQRGRSFLPFVTGILFI